MSTITDHVVTTVNVVVKDNLTSSDVISAELFKTCSAIFYTSL